MNPTQAETTLRTLTGSVQLAAADSTGQQADDGSKLYKKQLFSYGTWANPMWWWDGEPTMELTVDLASKMVSNFQANVLGSPVPIPRNHTDDVNANTGIVQKLEVGTDGLYGYLLIKDEKTIADIDGGLIFDVSIGFDWDYISQKDSTHYGPTLFHVALVNTPYINNMTGFTEAELAKRNHEYASALSVGGQQSVIMLSKSKVEELKTMKFARIKNDKDFDVTVKYTNDEGAEVEATVAAGAELEVPTTAKETVEQQVTDATAPAADDDAGDGLTDEERQAKAKEEADKKEADEKATADAKAAEEAGDTPPAPADETPEQELARVKARNAELEATKAYDELLAKGHIVPAQKDLFLSLARAGSVNLSSDIKGSDGKVLFAKSQSTSVVTMLSAILNAGPQILKLGKEQGTSAGQGEDAKVELTKEQEERIVHMGFNLETFKKQLSAGTISLTDLEEK